MAKKYEAIINKLLSWKIDNYEATDIWTRIVNAECFKSF